MSGNRTIFSRDWDSLGEEPWSGGCRSLRLPRGQQSGFPGSGGISGFFPFVCSGRDGFPEK